MPASRLLRPTVRVTASPCCRCHRCSQRSAAAACPMKLPVCVSRGRPLNVAGPGGTVRCMRASCLFDRGTSHLAQFSAPTLVAHGLCGRDALLSILRVVASLCVVRLTISDSLSPFTLPDLITVRGTTNPHFLSCRHRYRACRTPSVIQTSSPRKRLALPAKLRSWPALESLPQG
jgi:hypothetical protein